MKLRNKTQAINAFIQDLKSLVTRIENNDEVLSDYSLLQKLFELANVPEEIIKSCYETCGFNSWEHLYKERKKKNYSKENVGCSLARIRGVSKGVITVMSEYLRESSINTTAVEKKEVATA